ncbi:MAG: tetratricopeptide repeat protein [Betaproteobacteria bacterium]|jgi:tetratricopeptide (TPR) repeat protein|nr:tetratricopeptide repeat protein [Betaproteobacteria bacterium]
MLADRYGLPVSTSSEAALAAYVAGADCILSANAGGINHLTLAIEHDPGLALAHVALARGYFVEGDVSRARAAAARAREAAPGATRRELGHVNAIALAVESKPVESLEATRAHASEFPRDAMVVAPATGVFGLYGFSGRQDREPELHEFLAGLAPHYGDDWWFLSVFAFAACECGRLEEAERLIERGMAANPRNAHGAHIMVHVLHEMGRTEEALDYLERWMPEYNRRGVLHCHLSWHTALCAIALGKFDRAWDAYRTAVHPGASWGPALNVVTDGVSFLWRAELAGEPRRPEVWSEIHAHAIQSFPKASLSFADVHTAAACAATGDEATLARLLAEMRDRLAAGRLPAGEVVPTIADGFAAFAAGDWDRSARLLERALPEAVRIGGSRAQRDLVAYTLLAAYLKAERPEDARALIARRVDRRPAVEVAGFVP